MSSTLTNPHDWQITSQVPSAHVQAPFSTQTVSIKFDCCKRWVAKAKRLRLDKSSPCEKSKSFGKMTCRPTITKNWLINGICASSYCDVWRWSGMEPSIPTNRQKWARQFWSHNWTLCLVEGHWSQNWQPTNGLEAQLGTTPPCSKNRWINNHI